MPFKNSAFGKKQTSMPGPSSAAYKQIVARRNATSVAKPAGKSDGKRRRSSLTFSTLKSRQQLVERIQRDIWASVLKINDAIISLALAGNYSAAKGLFEFAGVYSLPNPAPGDPPPAALAPTT